MTATAFDSSAFLATCSGRPGVYRMFDEQSRLLYVGKASNLKKRLASYFPVSYTHLTLPTNREV